MVTNQYRSEVSRKASIARWHPDMVVELEPTDPRSRELLVARRNDLTKEIRMWRKGLPASAPIVNQLIAARADICAELHRRYSRDRRTKRIAAGLDPKTGRPKERS